MLPGVVVAKVQDLALGLVELHPIGPCPAFQPLCPKSVALPGVAVTEVQDPALGLVELHPIGLSPATQSIQIPL